MNLGTKSAFLLLFLAVMITGCLNASSTKPDWAHEVLVDPDEYRYGMKMLE